MKLDKGKVIFESEEELPPMTVSIGTTSWNQTGSWKYLEPFYQDLTPPCVDACKVGNDIVTFMRLIDEGRYEEAARRVLEHNPFPATLGRVCPHPCESPCNRKEMGGSIAIQSAERFIGDYALEHDLMPEMAPDTDMRVTVVGAGPAGLSAAYFLRRLGHRVTVAEAESQPGGLLWSGIPPYRLPREVLNREMDRISRMGVEFKYGVRVGADVPLEHLLLNSGAVLLAIGLTQSRALEIPGEEHPQVFDGLDLLRKLHLGIDPGVGKHVIVLGGGNTALDCARSLLRLGRDVTIVYRRSRAEMPAFAEEINEALEEGIRIEFLAGPIGIIAKNGTLSGIELIRMKLYEPPGGGRLQPMPLPGKEFCLPADSVVKALGETLDFTGLPAEIQQAHRIHNIDYMTPVHGLFACGDCLGNGGTVAQAVRGGREAACAVNAWLMNKEYDPPNPVRERNASPEVASFDRFTSDYFRTEYPPASKVTHPGLRVHDFSEVRHSLSENEIRAEAARCFKCGTCTQCDNCRFFCPDNAITWNADHSGYRVRYEYCKGCLVCVEECPRGAIHQRKVEV
jgi:NADPH-dependent glutamate synthase beta subunit-like oxidoreductase